MSYYVIPLETQVTVLNTKNQHYNPGGILSLKSSMLNPRVQPFTQSQSKNNGEHIRVIPTRLLKMSNDEGSVKIFESVMYLYQSFKVASQGKTTKNGFR